MKAIFRRNKNVFEIASQDAADMLNSIEDGKDVILEYKKNRSTANHRRFFAFRNLTFDMQDHFDDPEVWRRYLEACAGHFIQVVSPKTGQVFYIVDSIAWDELDDETEFQDLFNRVVNAFISRYGQKLTEEQLTMIVQF